jgi:RNA polymerase sigma factor (sigma-70 family)
LNSESGLSICGNRQEMAEKEEDISDKIDHLFRHEYGKLVSVLTKAFGTANIQLAEDVVQEAMLEALSKWSYSGIPDNPVGWIYKVAQYKAVNIVTREKYQRQYSWEMLNQLTSEMATESAFDHAFSDSEVADDQLRMIFTCCHPSISTDSQVALTLKTLCGFSIPEIAKAFISTEENINKRLVRARKNIREAEVSFEVPTGAALAPRLSSVLEVIYLLFNEGYQASSGEATIRYELCEEAIRLAEMIVSNVDLANNSEVSALLALMYFNASRFSSRVDASDNIVELEHQDRSRWDKELIQKGLHYLSFATQNDQVSSYHILATISAHHCTAQSFEATDWQSILNLYDNLLQLDPSPIVQLNRAVVLSMTANPGMALNEIEGIKDKTALSSYLPYYTVRAQLCRQTNQYEKANNLLEEALKLAPNEPVRLNILKKITEIKYI